MITTLYLVRHTQTIGNVEKRLTGRQDYELTEKGKEYIQALTDTLNNIKFDLIYSSTSPRAIKTVLPLAEINKKNIITDEALCEMYFGIFDGMKREDVNKINPLIHENHIKTNEIYGIPEQETTEEVADRMYNYIEKITKQNLGKNILIASHGVAIEAFLRKITGEPFIVKREEYSQKNTSINIVTYDNILDKFKVEVLNDYSHLYKE